MKLVFKYMNLIKIWKYMTKWGIGAGYNNLLEVLLLGHSMGGGTPVASNNAEPASNRFVQGQRPFLFIWSGNPLHSSLSQVFEDDGILMIFFI